MRKALTNNQGIWREFKEDVCSASKSLKWEEKTWKTFHNFLGSHQCTCLPVQGWPGMGRIRPPRPPPPCHLPYKQHQKERNASLLSGIHSHLMHIGLFCFVVCPITWHDIVSSLVKSLRSSDNLLVVDIGNYNACTKKKCRPADGYFADLNYTSCI